MKKAYGIKLQGIVQGVGYRPFIYNTALKYGLSGYTANKGGDLVIHIEGTEEQIEDFCEFIYTKIPIGAEIHCIEKAEVEVEDAEGFRINQSIEEKETSIGIQTDLGICDQCKSDIRETISRYSNYPFTSCVNCGPRFTVTRKQPYDRVNTTMEPFNMCEECKKEYESPGNRRYHAQTICCTKCGPKLRLLNSDRSEVSGESIITAKEMIKNGKIIAIKGIGGYHFVCNALDKDAITRLRELKKRRYKPLAVMFKDIEKVKTHCYLSQHELNQLKSIQKPIVILEQKKHSNLPEEINPGLNKLGVMLPYTGIHLMLFDQDIEAIVATSGNTSSLPLAYRDNDALGQLCSIADAFLIHDRDILVPCDDSVISVFKGTTQVIRRGRGYAPIPTRLSEKSRHTILACGADLKNTFCIIKDQLAYVSQHIGDMANLQTMKLYKKLIKHYSDMLDFRPDVIACDLHPDYLTSRAGQEMGLPVVKVQHHHAHITSVMAENNYYEDVIGVVFDGTGFGTDGTVWGGEFLIASLKNYERVGHFRQVPMPGGEKSAVEAWRMAGAYLQDSFGDNFKNINLDSVKYIVSNEWPLIWNSVKQKLNCINTSSAGRLFDAVSAIMGICYVNNYEGQAAMELESVALEENGEKYAYGISIGNLIVVDFRETIKGIVTDLLSKKSKRCISGKFHNTLSQIVIDTCCIIRDSRMLNTVALSGGVFQNKRLLANVAGGLKRSGFKVLTNRTIPCNDGGISFGQAVSAASQQN